jgi:hypothetical protein
MTRSTSRLALIVLFALSGLAQADTVTNSGTIDGSEPTFDNPATAATTLTPFDTLSFSVDTDGTYSFLSFYPGDTTADENLDGYLILGTAPLLDDVGGDDDYSAGDVAALGAFDSDCVGSNCSGFDAALTAGTSYTLTQTSFTDVANSFGQPTGPYDQTITGPGTITVVPVPSTSLLGLVGAALLCLVGRRRK